MQGTPHHANRGRQRGFADSTSSSDAEIERSVRVIGYSLGYSYEVPVDSGPTPASRKCCSPKKKEEAGARIRTADLLITNTTPGSSSVTHEEVPQKKSKG